jgi:hypothetical protein
MAYGPDASAQAVQHRNDTSHFVLAGLAKAGPVSVGEAA